MRPLDEAQDSEFSAVRGLLFDLDETLLDHGQLGEEGFRSLFALGAAGYLLFAVTGRPASWAEVIARSWPIHGAVGENGPLAFRRDGERLVRFDTTSSDTRRERRERLARLVDELVHQFPSLVPADDTAGRITDFAFDIGEHERASEELIARAVAFGRSRGAHTTRSSIHLHFTFDRHDKASGALAFLASLGEDPTSARYAYAYVGDSTNDAPCFAAFRHTIGVANVSGEFSLPPRWVTRSERSLGFAELAERLIRARTTHSVR